MNKLLIALLGMSLAGPVLAKLPPLSPEAQAKADETKQKTAWSDKVAAYQLCQAQDRVAAAYRKAKGAQPKAPAASRPGGCCGCGRACCQRSAGDSAMPGSRPLRRGRGQCQGWRCRFAAGAGSRQAARARRGEEVTREASISVAMSSRPQLSNAAAPLTHEVEVLDERGRVSTIAIPAERPLTVYVDKRELVTLMTLGGAPEALVLGYLRNQRLVRSLEDIASVQVDWALTRWR